MSDFTLKEVMLEIRDEVKTLRAELASIMPEHKDNTTFRKNVINGVVGTAFIALCALGVALLKITGVLKL